MFASNLKVLQRKVTQIEILDFFAGTSPPNVVLFLMESCAAVLYTILLLSDPSPGMYIFFSNKLQEKILRF